MHQPGGFSKIVHISLHSFSDTSGLGYGESSYLRLVDEYRHIHYMMAKARVMPRKFVSIPQLELVTAVLAVKISALIKNELEIEELTKYFWTDSKVVLGYIANDSRAFKTFVANRVQAIQEYSRANQWFTSHQKTIQLMMLLEVCHLKIFLTLLGSFRVQHVYGNHNQVGRILQLKKQIKMLHLISNGRSR